MLVNFLTTKDCNNSPFSTTLSPGLSLQTQCPGPILLHVPFLICLPSLLHLPFHLCLPFLYLPIPFRIPLPCALLGLLPFLVSHLYPLVLLQSHPALQNYLALQNHLYSPSSLPDPYLAEDLYVHQ